ncbi:subtilisin-like protein [Phanerochaete sordida]|uniref:tripeptidyl-peptidase II n=1 Tax=Phanerochaete sordida TaxID=48140 RepID=A0A9P3GSJ1_9APHY|nr:subtilisin-like protein [Phanerochaete sordida]
MLSSHLRVLAAVASLCIASLAVPHASRVVHESRRSLPTGWTPIRRADPDLVLPLRIGLTQSNLHLIEEYLLDVSHPSSPNYGKHWTPARIASAFRPAPESAAAVRDWLADSGVEAERVRVGATGGWVHANVSVAEAEALLGTEYFVYAHADAPREHVACHGAYHVPAHVAPHVDLITPTLHFDVKLGRDGVIAEILGSSSPTMKGPAKELANDLSTCDQQITPDCIRALYNFHGFVPLAAHKNSLAIVEYGPETYTPDDMDMFFKNFSATQIGERPNLISIDGGSINFTNADHAESNLDLQYSMSLVGKGQEVTLFQVGDAIQSASFDNLLDALDGTFCTFEGGDNSTLDGVYPDPNPAGFQGPEQCGGVKPAFVQSTSYSHDERLQTPLYSHRQCTEYAKLGLLGVTVLHSSGDRGVAGRNNLCLNPDGTVSTSAKIFSPSFPGVCPFITSVGATQINTGAKVTDPESVCSEVIQSGGGFSNQFPVPSYQQAATAEYLKKFPPPYPAGTFNASGRGYPDISANGANYVVAITGRFELVFGTSASTPVTASLLSAINDARLAIGKGPIGFINPALYSDPFKGAFNDITNGSNPGCGTQGFAAQPGWDPATGLGTPNFVELRNRFLLLP